LALTNKVAHSFCNDAQFWQDKFTYYVLPQLVVIKECKKAVSVPRKMLQLPNNINNWMKAYIKMLEAHQLAIKLVNNILDTKKFKNFLIGGQGARQMHWLPPNIIDTLIDKYHKWYSLGFKIEFINEPMYYIQINGLGHQCSKQEFINYITLLIYYSNKNLSFENDKEDMWLYISDLQTHTDYIKSIFPNW
jgi:hypothetical protein